jgi:tRNA A-37 threonylcarbamoyl transferase component Bud32
METPVTANIIIESFTLQLKSCIREVPQKRLVFTGLWGEKAVLVKVFCHKSSAQRHFQRELKGIKAFTDAAILTPKLLWSGNIPASPEHKIYESSPAVITAWVDNAQSLDEAWNNSGLDQKKSLAATLLTTIKEHHAKGLVQTDMHLGNFLLKGKDVYSLDGDALEYFNGPVPFDESIHNLTLLIAQLNVIDAPILLSALASKERDAVSQKLSQVRQKRCEKYLSKAFRECTEIKHLKSSGREIYLVKEFDLKEFNELLADPNKFFPNDKKELLKNGNSATVAIVKCGMQELVVKRYNYSKNLKTFFRRFRTSRAAISWKNAFRLKNYGLNTPRPWAFMETKVGPVVKFAYFIAEKSTGESALEFFKKLQDEQSITKYINIICEMFLVFKECRIVHGDCKATNFLVEGEGVMIIDLDAMKEVHSKKFERLHQKDLLRWLQNWDDSLELRLSFEEAFKVKGLLS